MGHKELEQLMLVMLRSQRPTAARDMSITSWCAMNIGGGDDARLVFMPDLLPPLLMRIIGGSQS